MHAVSPRVLHKMSATTLLLTPPRSLSPCSDLEEEAGSRIRVRSVLMRAGTSKGLFFRLEDLPFNRQSWGPILLAAMGSPDPACRQLDGLGGGQSTLSKVAVVSRSDCPDADVDYLFIQGTATSLTAKLICSPDRWLASRLYWQLWQHVERSWAFLSRVSVRSRLELTIQ